MADDAMTNLAPDERIIDSEFGPGVVFEAAYDGYLRAFFGAGERRVPRVAIQRALSRTERILRAVDGSAERASKTCLSYEADALR